MANPIIGIDLGTTNCAVTKYERGKTTVLPIKGKLTTPSVLYIEGSTVKVGHDAKKYIAVRPEKCLASTKRDMGTTTVYNIGGKEITPVLAASLILKYLKEETEAYLNDVCNDVVITIPAYFGFKERNATKQAAINAGWNPIALLNEPTAAAIIYGQNRNRSSLFTVVDLGGGTFDVTVLQYLNENGKAKFKPLKVGGNHRLGGDDFDNAIVRYMIDEGASGYKSELELKEEAEKAKIALSTSDVAGISCEYVDTTLTRDKYKELISTYLDEICNTIKNTVSGAGKSLDDIDRFILVGGSCKHPVVKDAIKECVGRTPYAADNLDTAVSEGAALYHHFHNQIDIDDSTPIVDSICPKTLGTDLAKDEVVNIVMVKEGAKIPCKVCQLAYFGGMSLHTKVLEGDGYLASDCKELYEMVVDMKNPGVGHAIVTVYDIDDSGCLTFYTYEIQPGCDIEDLKIATEPDTLKFDYSVWEEFIRTHSSSEYYVQTHTLDVK